MHRIRAGGSWVRVGDCLKCLKRGCNRKEGRGNKDLKNAGGGSGKLVQGVGALKRGMEPLTNYGNYKTIQSKLSKYEQVEREV